MSWLVASIVASVGLTIVLNLVVRLFPGPTGRAADHFAERAVRHDEPRVQVWFPWKAMLAASILATVVLNLIL